MKITCQACAAKYTIADDKVLGKIVKIRCKKCGATIVVNGNDPGAAAGAAGPAVGAYDYAGQGAQGDTWTVNVADGDQRTMTDAEVTSAYHAGVVSDETFCWKDGMTDWLPLREIEPLIAACTTTRAVASEPPNEGVTRVQQTGPGLFAGSPAPAAYAAPRPAAGMAAGNGAVAMQAPAARRAGGRAPAADLFSGAAQAGSEEEVMTSAPAGMPQVHDDGKLTGARNENSVLFSLNALTSKGPGGPSGVPMAPSSEASGLIDIRQLSAQIGIEDKKKSRIDDIMNLAGGGAFSPSLSAPILSAPPIEEYAPPPEAAGATGALPVAGSKSKGLIIGAIGAGLVVVVGAIGLAVMLMGNKSDKDKAAASASASEPSPSALAMNTPSGSSTATSPPDTAPTASGAPTDTGTSTAATPPPAATTKSTATTAATTKPTTTATHDAPPKDTAPAATAAPAAAAGADAPFNMGEAKARLGAIAGSVQACKKGDVSGSGRVVVTFAPSGQVTSAVVSGPPFAGTPTGACVASRFRGAHVPAFSGSPFPVSKSFTIN